jgi:hypothetical protein
VGDPVEDGGPVVAGDRRFEGQEFVQGRAQRVDVGPVVHHPGLGLRLLRAHVPQRPEQVAGDGQLGMAADQGQPEVGHPQLAAGVEQEVGRLDVAVDDAHLVGVLQRLGRLGAQARRVPAVFGARARAVRRAGHPAGGARGRGGDPVRRAVPQLADRLRQGPPFDELHGVVVDAPLAPDRVHRHDVRVVEQRGGLGLVSEPLELSGIERRGERQDLEGDPAAEGELLGLVHHPHPAAADLADQAEVPQQAQSRRDRREVAGPGEVVERSQGGQEPAQLLRVLGVRPEGGRQVQRLAGLEPLRQQVHQFGQAGGGRRFPVGGHGPPPGPRGARSSCNRRNARKARFLAASSLTPRASPTSRALSSSR